MPNAAEPGYCQRCGRALLPLETLPGVGGPALCAQCMRKHLPSPLAAGQQIRPAVWPPVNTPNPSVRSAVAKWVGVAVVAILFLVVIGRSFHAGLFKGLRAIGGGETETLSQARTGFTTTLARNTHDGTPPDAPPPELFNLVHYPSSVGPLAAYVGVDPKDEKRHPAIIWIFGGFGNGIGDTAWAPASPANDQSASAFRRAGLIMMYPSLRGGNDNPGSLEGFYGEVNDVLAAADFLQKQDYVDPSRIYLGGHSTGGTLVLLTAEISDRFRAVFSFGPVDRVDSYGPDNLPFDLRNAKEVAVRSPIRWLSSIRTPVFVMEGTGSPNIRCLHAMATTSKNPQIHFIPIDGATHFSGLAPVTAMIADKILHDAAPACNISITGNDMNQAVSRLQAGN